MLTDEEKKNIDQLVKSYRPSIIRAFEYKNTQCRSPDTLQYLWSQAGIANWASGTFRTCDPDLVWGALEDALEGKALLSAKTCLPYGISAFGQVYAWNENVGSVRFDFQNGKIVVRNDPSSPRINLKETAILTPIPNDKSTLDEFNLYDAAVEKFGYLNENQIFSFSPALALGGVPNINNVIIVDAKIQLIFLAQTHKFEIFHFNSRKFKNGYSKIE